MLLGEAPGAEGAGDVSEAGGPEGEGIEGGLAENDLVGCLQGRPVDEASEGAGEVSVLVLGAAHGLCGAATVEADDASVGVAGGDREHASVEFVARVGVGEAEAGEALADGASGGAVLVGEGEAEGAIDEADLEVSEELGGVQAPLGEVGQGGGVLGEFGVVVAGDLGEQGSVVCVEGDRRGQQWRSGAFRRVSGGWREEGRGVGPEQFDTVANAPGGGS